MNILIDRNPVTIEGRFSVLGELITEITNSIVPEERCLLKIIVNGAELQNNDVKEITSLSLKEIRELEFVTVNEGHLCRTFLQEAESIIHDMCRSALKIASVFRNRDDEDASVHEFYMDLMASFRDLIHTMLHTQKTLQMYDGIRVDVQAAEETKEASCEIFNKLIEAQKGQDWLLLADLLEYELVGILEKWKKTLPVIN